MRVTFVYSQPRRALLDQIALRQAPDSPLLGQRHLAEFGIEADVYDPRLTRRRWRSRAANWWAWYGRELTLPWELPQTDAVCTPLSTLFPLAGRLRSRPVFLLNHGLCNTLSRASPARRRTQIVALRASAGVICHSTADRLRLIADAGLDPERVHMVALGVDQSFFSPREEESDYVLAVGFDLGRDYATFMQAVRELPYRVIVAARLRNLKGIAVPSNVEVIPDPSFVELRDLYAAARCVVVPVRRDEYPFGGDTSGVTSVLEAMAMAKPVIVSERRTWSDYIEPDRSGRIVPTEDSERLRDVIRETFDDRSLRRELGEGALEAVRRSHTSRQMSERIAAVLRSGASNGRRAAATP